MINISIKEKLENLWVNIETNKIGKSTEWGGADVVICSVPDQSQIKWAEEQNIVIGFQYYEPKKRLVVTKHSKELSWLFNELKEIFSEKIDFANKYDFYGLLAQTAINYINYNKVNENINELLISVISQAMEFIITDSDVKYYFAYGKNMDINELQDRLKKHNIENEEIQNIINTRKLGTLNGYSLVFNKKASDGDYSYANIKKNKNDIVEGILFDFKYNSFISCLDKNEGYPKHYRRELRKINNNNETVYAVVYIANNDYIIENLKPKMDYINHLLAGAEGFLSKDYILKKISKKDE